MRLFEKLLLVLVVGSTLVVLFCEAFPINLVTRSASMFKAEEAVGMFAAIVALASAIALALMLARNPRK